MRQFIPTTGPEVACYNGTTASNAKPALLDGVFAEKAARNPDFTEVFREKPARKKKATRKKRVSKK